MEEQHTPRRERRPLPAVSASITAAAAELGLEPPTPEQIAGIQGATVVLPPDSAASAGARGVYDNIEHNTMLRDAGYVELGVDPADPGAEVEVPPNGGRGTAATAGRLRRPPTPPCHTSPAAARRSLAQWANGPASRPATPTPGRSTVWASALTLRPTTCRWPMWAAKRPAR